MPLFDSYLAIYAQISRSSFCKIELWAKSNNPCEKTAINKGISTNSLGNLTVYVEINENTSSINLLFYYIR
jgi:hypothetical protein